MDQVLSPKDEIVMKLLHYFITEQDYTPIVLHGAKNEIWLENLNKDYHIVRIVSNYIHNNEQLDFDLFKTKQIRKQIKKKTLSINCNILNIFVNLGENVNLDNITSNDMLCLNVNSLKDFKKYTNVLEIYPNIMDDQIKAEGMDLFIKLSTDINEKTEREAIMNEKIFTLKKPIVTYILIAINILVFILMYVLGNGSYDVATLIKFGANNANLVKAGDYYRLFTSAFLHIGVMHLACNMYALYVIGPQLESFFGRIKFLVIYIGGAIIGNLLSNVISTNSIGAGASGAIFALLGALLYFGYHYRVYLGNVIKSQVIPIIVINLAVGFIVPGISTAAHLGGLLGGISLAAAVGIPNNSSTSDKINGWVITLILTGFLIYMSLFR